MTYAVIKVTNGTFKIHSEGWTDLDKAKVNFHQLCATLWNADDVETASAMIVDENLSGVGMYYEVIDKRKEETVMPIDAITES